jgi:ferrous iron transport protein A
MQAGQSGTVVKIEGGYDFQRRLALLGVRADKIVRKVGSGAFKGPVVIEVDRAKIAIGRGMAIKILVEELQV